MDYHTMRSCAECGISCPSKNKKYLRISCPAGQNVSVVAEKYSILLFVVSGQVEVASDHQTPCLVSEGHTMLLSQHHRYTLTAIEEAQMLRVALSERVGVCQYVSTNDLYDAMQKVVKACFPLAMEDRMKDFVQSVLRYLDDRIDCQYLYGTKDSELFSIFRHYYTLEQVTQLFYPILEGGALFRSLVVSNYPKAKNVEQLASLCGYGLSNFKRLFKQYFDQTPYQWMLAHMAGDVRQALLDTETPLKEIAWRFNFADQSHLNAFCKKHLGATPGQIREG